MPFESENKMKLYNYIFLIALSVVLIYSCSDDQCNSETESLVKAEVLVKSSELTSIKYLDNLSIYSPEWTDSIHYAKEGSDNSLYFTLSPNSDTTEIIFTSEVAPLKDTIFIFYQRELVFLSPECGFVTNCSIDTVITTNNYIDSLEVVNPETSTNENGHIKIYF